MTAAIRLALTQRSGLRRSNVTGADAVALDVVLAVLRANVAGEHLEATLGGGVGTHGLATQLTHHGAYIDDFALPARHHLRNHGRRTDVRTHQVHVNHALELCTGHLVHGNALDDTGVVHQNVYLPYLCMNLLYQFFYSLFIRHIAYIAVYIGNTGLFVCLQPLFHRSLVGRIKDDVFDTGLHKSLGNSKANAVCGSCYPGILALQREKICHKIL